MGDFAPVGGYFRDEKVTRGEQRQGQREPSLRDVVIGRNEVEEAREDEAQREGVGADHPLAMRGDVAITRRDKGKQGAQEPKHGLESSHEDHGKGKAAEAEQEGHRRGDGDADDVDPAHEAVEVQVLLAETGGELEGAESGGGDAGDGVGNDEEAIVAMWMKNSRQVLAA
jgi:hypothetical protein